MRQSTFVNLADAYLSSGLRSGRRLNNSLPTLPIECIVGDYHVIHRHHDGIRVVREPPADEQELKAA